ncbi:Speckle-type POZ protein, partial [Stegodyphus mimosarum]
MFETEMRESKNSIVEISDMDPDVIDEMLLFMYSGETGKPLEETGTRLYTLADKYDIPVLKQKCSSFLKSSLTVSNVCEVVQLADLHSDEELCESSIEFIWLHAKDVFATNEWREMSK